MKKLISKKLFDLTPEQKDKSIKMYGKVIKCLIAPYHTINRLPLEHNDNVYVYPERDLTIEQRKELISDMCNTEKDEYLLVTSDMFIISDLITDCVRILTNDAEIIECSIKPFGANLYDVLKILRQEKTYNESSKYRNILRKLITDIENKKPMTKDEFDNAKFIINSTGDEIISLKLNEMLKDITII